MKRDKWVTDNFDLQDQKDDNKLRCAGMYSRKSWGGSVDPYILVKFMKPAEPEKASVSLVIFEWKDEDLIGVYPKPGATSVCPIVPSTLRPLLIHLAEGVYLQPTEYPE